MHLTQNNNKQWHTPADFKLLSECVLARGLIWMFECLCIRMCVRVCSSKPSKDRLACNSLLITVILPQLCSASIVIALLFWKTQGGKDDMTERRAEKKTTGGQNEPSFLWLNVLSVVVLIHVAMWWFYWLPISLTHFTLSHTHSDFLTLPFFPLCVDIFHVHTCRKPFTLSPLTHTHSVESPSVFSLFHPIILCRFIPHAYTHACTIP